MQVELLQEQLVAARRDAQGWREGWEADFAASGGGAGRRLSQQGGGGWGFGGGGGGLSSGAGAAAGASRDDAGGSSGSGSGNSSSGSSGSSNAAVKALEAELARSAAQHRADIARRDAVLAKCRDAILSLEAQLAGGFGLWGWTHSLCGVSSHGQPGVGQLLCLQQRWLKSNALYPLALAEARQGGPHP